MDHDQALEIAPRYGWIDGTARRVDDQYFVQKFTPRLAELCGTDTPDLVRQLTQWAVVRQ